MIQLRCFQGLIKLSKAIASTFSQQNQIDGLLYIYSTLTRWSINFAAKQQCDFRESRGVRHQGKTTSQRPKRKQSELIRIDLFSFWSQVINFLLPLQQGIGIFALVKYMRWVSMCDLTNGSLQSILACFWLVEIYVRTRSSLIGI